MIFASTFFIYVFLPITLVVYYVFLGNKRKAGNYFLLAASLVFYMWDNPKFVFIMLFSIVMNYIFGVLIEKYVATNNIQKIILIIAILTNITILYIYKYYAFSISIINYIFKSDFNVRQMLLPLGVSFYTFQALSYVIDVYRGKGKAQKNILNVGLYISFFPQLVAGPIVRYENISSEIEERRESIDDFLYGLDRFIIGMAKKVLLANSFAKTADYIFDLVSRGESISALTGWIGAICYTFQIYYDFSGYSDMAIGLGRMFGFHFQENFNYPYFSTSITEFWRRWHISLSQWFRDYIYIPLGGNRKGKTRTVINMLVVWLATGIWHGANWTFILWGLMYFVLLVIEKRTSMLKPKGLISSIISWMYTMLFVVIGWIIFKSDSLSIAFEYIGCLFKAKNYVVDDLTKYELIANWKYLILGGVMATPIIASINNRVRKKKLYVGFQKSIYILLFIVSVARIVSSAYNPFIYFNF